MTFRRRAVRSAAVAAGIALTMAMALTTPAEADTNGGARSDSGRAAAAPARPAGTDAIIINREPVPASGKVNCYNYIGTFKQGTYVVVVDWQASTSDECFGIATDRTIWHAWPGSGGWKPMPGNGHADAIHTIWDNAAGDRQVGVYVAASPTDWCQDYSRSGGWTGSWYRCG
jgi:hypothetical protein